MIPVWRKFSQEFDGIKKKSPTPQLRGLTKKKHPKIVAVPIATQREEPIRKALLQMLSKSKAESTHIAK